VVEGSGSASDRRPARSVGATLGSPSRGHRGSRSEASLVSTRSGRLNAPRPALVETGPGGTPRLVNRELVTLVREEWIVVDRWWTEEPIDRRYFEVVLESGRNVCVYRDREARCWFTQAA
jgi:hypothetical protein